MLRLAVASIALFIVSACPAKPRIDLNDAGAPSGGEGEGEGASGEGEGEGEGAVDDNRGTPCTLPAGAECDPGLACVSEKLDPVNGTCRKPCATVDSTGKPVLDNPSPCTNGDTCQEIVFFDNASQSLKGDLPVCLPQQTAANGPCFAFLDPNACSDNRLCDVVDVATADPNNPNSNLVLVTECKDKCPLGASGADQSCPAGETCGRPVIAIALDQFQPGANGAHVPCNINSCSTSNACPCQRANGFECINTNEGQECARLFGHCGAPVENLNAADASTQPPEKVCDDEAGTVCDDRAYRGSSLVAEESCARGYAFSSTDPSAGFCAAVCDQPAFDYDGNGQISAGAGGIFGLGEQQITAPCPTGQFCGYDVSSTMFWAGFASNNCSLTTCPDINVPCPDCGGADLRCLDGFCAALLGLCEDGTGPGEGEGEGEGAAGEGEGEGAAGEGEGEGAAGAGEGEGEGAAGEGEGEGAAGEGEGEGLLDGGVAGEGEGAAGEGEGEGPVGQ